MQQKTFSLHRYWFVTVCTLVFATCLFAVASYSQNSQSWRGLNIPKYPHAEETVIKTEHDEYTLYFVTKDSAKKVADFYQKSLQHQGFNTVSARTEKDGYEVKMKSRSNSHRKLELSVKQRPIRTTVVEIEF